MLGILYHLLIEVEYSVEKVHKKRDELLLVPYLHHISYDNPRICVNLDQFEIPVMILIYDKWWCEHVQESGGGGGSRSVVTIVQIQ